MKHVETVLELTTVHDQFDRYFSDKNVVLDKFDGNIDQIFFQAKIIFRLPLRSIRIQFEYLN